MPELLSASGGGAAVAIVGAGIAGLSAAWELLRSGRRDFVLFEASARVGGVIGTERPPDGFLLEQGPDSFLRHKPAGVELCRELGLEAELIPALPGGARILHAGRLEPLPAGWRMAAPTELEPVLNSPLFSNQEKAALAANWEPDAAAAEPEDESVAQFLRRRYGPLAGQAFADRVAGPMLAGVYGGAIEELSHPATLGRGGRASRTGAGSPFLSLRRGMGTLAETLADRLPARTLQLNRRVRALTKTAAGYGLGFEAGEPCQVQAVVLATCAPVAARLLESFDAALAARLAAVPYGSSLNVNVAYGQAPALPPGSGFLVPREEGWRARACTFAHQKLPGRAPAGAALLRLFYTGGELDWSDARIEALAQHELGAILGIRSTPSLIRIQRWPASMPQYTVGHGERMNAIRAALAKHPRLALAGNAYQGVGVPDCIASGVAAVKAFGAGIQRGAEADRLSME